MYDAKRRTELVQKLHANNFQQIQLHGIIMLNFSSILSDCLQSYCSKGNGKEKELAGEPNVEGGFLGRV